MNPINVLLTAIAVADGLVMVEYIPFAIHMHLLKGSSRTIEEKVPFNVTDLLDQNSCIPVLIQMGSIPSVPRKRFNVLAHRLSMAYAGVGCLAVNHDPLSH